LPRRRDRGGVSTERRKVDREGNNQKRYPAERYGFSQKDGRKGTRDSLLAFCPDGGRKRGGKTGRGKERGKKAQFFVPLCVVGKEDTPWGKCCQGAQKEGVGWGLNRLVRVSGRKRSRGGREPGVSIPGKGVRGGRALERNVSSLSGH